MKILIMLLVCSDMCEYAIVCKSFAVFASLDDKHKINVGRPGCPVAAAEHGCQVLGTFFH